MRQPNPPSDHRKSRGEELRNIGEDLHKGPDGKPDPTPASLHLQAWQASLRAARRSSPAHYPLGDDRVATLLPGY